jgi:hypothetical protein
LAFQVLPSKLTQVRLLSLTNSNIWAGRGLRVAALRVDPCSAPPPAIAILKVVEGGSFLRKTPLRFQASANNTFENAVAVAS